MTPELTQIVSTCLQDFQRQFQIAAGSVYWNLLEGIASLCWSQTWTRVDMNSDSPPRTPSFPPGEIGKGKGPPPPPPPPLLPNPSPSGRERIGVPASPQFEVVETVFEVAQYDQQEIIKFVESRRWMSPEDREADTNILLAIISDVHPVLQRGPVCGLVALQMVGNLLEERELDANDFLAEAREQQMTKQGEMFVAKNLLQLGGQFFPKQRWQLLHTTEESAFQDIAKNLVDGNPLLVPYDADFNHAPALRRGHAAHWATVHGIFVVLPRTGLEPDLQEAIKDTSFYEEQNLYIFHPPSTETVTKKLLKKLICSSPKANVFAVCHQGKSAHVGIWRLDELLRSNQNLNELGPKIDALSNSMITADIKVELCSKAILIQRT